MLCMAKSHDFPDAQVSSFAERHDHPSGFEALTYDEKCRGFDYLAQQAIENLARYGVLQGTRILCSEGPSIT
jgi:hypothetical protein